MVAGLLCLVFGYLGLSTLISFMLELILVFSYPFKVMRTICDRVYASLQKLRKAIIDILRQRSRPYLCSNSLSPAIVGASITVFDLLSQTTELRDRLERNTIYFKEKIIAAGFDIKPGDSPIVPIMLYDAALSQTFADELLKEGIYAIGFFYPVVAKGQARIRTQISAAHTIEDLDKAIAAFTKIGKQLGVIH